MAKGPGVKEVQRTRHARMEGGGGRGEGLQLTAAFSLSSGSRLLKK